MVRLAEIQIQHKSNEEQYKFNSKVLVKLEEVEITMGS